MSLTFAAATVEPMHDYVADALGAPRGGMVTALLDGASGPSISLSSNSAALVFRALGVSPSTSWEGGEVDSAFAAEALDDRLAGPNAWLLNSYDRSVLSEVSEIAHFAVRYNFPLFAWV